MLALVALPVFPSMEDTFDRLAPFALIELSLIRLPAKEGEARTD